MAIFDGETLSKHCEILSTCRKGQGPHMVKKSGEKNEQVFLAIFFCLSFHGTDWKLKMFTNNELYFLYFDLKNKNFAKISR